MINNELINVRMVHSFVHYIDTIIHLLLNIYCMLYIHIVSRYIVYYIIYYIYCILYIHVQSLVLQRSTCFSALSPFLVCVQQ